ncbi:MAG: YhdP family protein, partial [Planctomycetota bacterium]
MRAEERAQVGPKKKSKKRRLIWVVVPLVLVAVVVLLVPVLVSSHSGRRLILSKINNSVDGTVDIGDLSMSWWKGVKVSDLSFTDQAGQTSVAVREITSKPHYGSLLFGNLSFGRTDIYEPKVRIKVPEPAPATAEEPRQPAADKPAAPIVPVSRIDLLVHQGNFKISDAKTQQVEVSKIDSKLALRPVGEQTSFEATMKVAGQAKESNVDVAGQIKPSKASGWSFKGTSGTLTVKVDDLDLGSLGPIFALAGVEVETRGSVSADIKSEIKDGQVQDLVGQVKGKDLDITGKVLRGDQLKSSVLDATIELAQEQQAIDVRKLNIDTDWLDAELGGTMPTSIESLAQLVESDSPYSLNGRFECNLAAAMSQMPQTLGIKEGLKITSGKLTGRVETSTGDAKKRLKGSVNLTGLTGQMGAKKLALSQPVTAEAQVTADEAGVIFEKVDLSASFAKIRLAGSVEKLTYEEQVDLGKLSAELGQFLDMGGYKVGGEVLGKGNVSIAEDKISAAGSGVVKDLRLSSAEGLSASEPNADIGFSVVVERDRNVLAVNKIEAKTGLGQVSINDAVVPLGEKAAEAMKLNLSASDVDLA